MAAASRLARDLKRAKEDDGIQPDFTKVIQRHLAEASQQRKRKVRERAAWIAVIVVMVVALLATSFLVYTRTIPQVPGVILGSVLIHLILFFIFPVNQKTVELARIQHNIAAIEAVQKTLDLALDPSQSYTLLPCSNTTSCNKPLTAEQHSTLGNVMLWQALEGLYNHAALDRHVQEYVEALGSLTATTVYECDDEVGRHLEYLDGRPHKNDLAAELARLVLESFDVLHDTLRGTCYLLEDIQKGRVTDDEAILRGFRGTLQLTRIPLTQAMSSVVMRALERQDDPLSVLEDAVEHIGLQVPDGLLREAVLDTVMLLFQDSLRSTDPGKMGGSVLAGAAGGLPVHQGMATAQTLAGRLRTTTDACLQTLRTRALQATRQMQLQMRLFRNSIPEARLDERIMEKAMVSRYGNYVVLIVMMILAALGMYLDSKLARGGYLTNFSWKDFATRPSLDNPFWALKVPVLTFVVTGSAVRGASLMMLNARLSSDVKKLEARKDKITDSMETLEKDLKSVAFALSTPAGEVSEHTAKELMEGVKSSIAQLQTCGISSVDAVLSPAVVVPLGDLGVNLLIVVLTLVAMVVLWGMLKRKLYVLRKGLSLPSTDALPTAPDYIVLAVLVIALSILIAWSVIRDLNASAEASVRATNESPCAPL
jgi:ABC-type multidrug transport system fused ATPase/permease subunit